jgi:hypothetical protein
MNFLTKNCWQNRTNLYLRNTLTALETFNILKNRAFVTVNVSLSHFSINKFANRKFPRILRRIFVSTWVAGKFIAVKMLTLY